MRAHHLPLRALAFVLCATLGAFGCTDDDASKGGGTSSITTNAAAGDAGGSPVEDTGSGGVDDDAGAASGDCATNDDCAATPNTPYCAANGACVACIEGDPSATCASGQCCSRTCVDTDTDTTNCGGCGTVCDLPNAAETCAAGSCDVASCDAGFADCDDDPTNGCELDTSLGDSCICVPGAVDSCYSGPAGTAGVGICTAGTRTCNADGTGYGPCQGEVLPEAVDTCADLLDNDCDGLANNGLDDGGLDCVCVPGELEPCYEGPPGTEGVGVCVGGMRECEVTGRTFRFCSGQVLPSVDLCSNGIDEDCSGTVDDPPDADGDGWTICQGDCCDAAGMGCSDPALVNPGALEFGGNMVDDDCDGTVDNAPAACDANLTANSSTGLDYAAAMDLCQTTSEMAPIDQQTWGVISAQFSLADGSGTPVATSRSIRPGFGTGITTQNGVNLVSLSTGTAAAPGDPAPLYSAVQPGLVHGVSSGVPGDWIAANAGNFPNAPGCPDPQNGTTANDPVMLSLRVRVPTNANSFSVNSYFLSSEYPEWVCSAFNDFFLVLLDSSFTGTPANPTDKNLATYTDAMGAVYPVGVNLAYGDTGLFQQCLNGSTGCGDGSVVGTTSTCISTSELAGTGFDAINASPAFINDPSGCGASNLAGGGTGWRVTSGNVIPGEIIELRFVLWDTGDGYYDSTALLDNFVWNVNASQPGTD